jgi:hypothetical protein
MRTSLATNFSAPADETAGLRDFLEPLLRDLEFSLPTGAAANDLEPQTAHQVDAGDELEGTVVVPRVRPAGTENKVLQRWEGRVLSATDADVTAVISDRTEPSNPDEEVVFSRDELSAEDQALVRPGAVFYWSIRYEQGAGIPRQRVNRIRFRRLLPITATELARASERAAQIRDLWK